MSWWSAGMPVAPSHSHESGTRPVTMKQQTLFHYYETADAFSLPGVMEALFMNVSWSRQIADFSRVFDEVSGKATRFSRQVVEFSGRVNNLSGKIADWSGKFNALSRQVVRLSRQIAQLSRQVASLSRQVARLSLRIADLSGQVVYFSCVCR